MSSKLFILEIESFDAGRPLITGIFSYHFPELGPRNHPTQDKETGKVKITSLLVRRAGDKYTPQFAIHAFSGKTFPKISLMDSVSVRGSTFKRTFLTCAEVGIENFIPREAKGEKTEDILFYFEDYQLNI